MKLFFINHIFYKIELTRYIPWDNTIEVALKSITTNQTRINYYPYSVTYFGNNVTGQKIEEFMSRLRPEHGFYDKPLFKLVV